MRAMLSNSLRARAGVAIAAMLLLLAGTASADPPARAVRLAYADGGVSFVPAGGSDWVQARLNRPLWTGDQLWTAEGARAELQMGNAALRIAPETSFSIVNFDDRTEQFQVNQGTVDLYLRSMEGTIEIDTPNLAFSIRSPGQYRVDVDAEATTVAVYRGGAEAFGTQAAYVINVGERFRFRGTDLNDYQPLPIAQRDPFDRWVAQRVRLEERSLSARYVAPDVIGYADLDRYGAWRDVPTYGKVWVPTGVAPDWAPYRYGHWAWIDPWGWTWIDDAPWGFAPFHYGRWAFAQNRWCWVPGPRHVRPVYAPALVAFVGGSNFGVSVSVGHPRDVAWFPLAPGEVYRPAYDVSRDYFTRVNVTNTVVNVTQVTNVYNNPTRTNMHYANLSRAHAVTAVPTQAFVDARPVQRAAIKVDANAIRQAHVVDAVPVAPVKTSIVGAAAPARARPNAAVMERAVIAKQAPPPPPPSLQRREEALKRQPGKPLEPAELHRIAPQNATERSNVRVAQPTAAPRPLPPTATRAAEKGAPQREAPPTAGRGEQRAQPPVAGAPSKAGEQRRGPPPSAMGSEKKEAQAASPEAKERPPAAPVSGHPTEEARPRRASPPGVEQREATARPGAETPRPPQAATGTPEAPPPSTAQAPGAREPLKRPGAPPIESGRGPPPTARARPETAPAQAARAPVPPPQDHVSQRPETAHVAHPPTAQALPKRPENAQAARPTPHEPAQAHRGPAAPPRNPESAALPHLPAAHAPPQRPEAANTPRPVPRESAPASRAPAAPPKQPETASVQRPQPVARAPSAAPPGRQEARPPQHAAVAGPLPQRAGGPAEKGPPSKGTSEKDREKQKEENK